MGLWSFWLIVAVAFMIAEVLVLSLTCLYTAVGALAAMVCALLGGGWTASIITFVAGTALLYAATYKYRKRLLHLLHRGNSHSATGMDALIGRTGRLETMDSTRMRIDGDCWQVRPASSDVDLLPGDEVRVTGYDSIVLIVEKITGNQNSESR